MQVARIKTGVLVIGGGLAGLAAALGARQRDSEVLIAAKGKVGRSGNTIMARNSMAAVLSEGEGGDAVDRHVADTLAGGAYLNDARLVEILAGGARDAVNRLMESGVTFLSEGGRPVVKGSPGHSAKRSLTVAGGAVKSQRTPGMAMTLPLLQKVKSSGVKMMENLLVTGLLVKEGRVAGAWGLDRGGAGVRVVEARAVVLASGGAGRLYPLTTNTADVTGDGYALAYLAGAKLRDMEFVQFHPVVAIGPPKLVISTAVFADGAVLRNRHGEAYMKKYSSQGDMATRDVMARANFMEISAGRGTERGGVLMDFRGVPARVLAGKFTDIHSYLQGKSMLEVAPAAHFMMGGVRINERCRTTLPGLYACGEAAGGVHGANRLAGNALTEAAVFGLLAGREAADEAQTGTDRDKLPDKYIKEVLMNGKVLPGFSGGAVDGEDAGGRPSFSDIAGNLRGVMGRHAGLVRTGKGLTEARNRLGELTALLGDCSIKSYQELLCYHQVRLMLITAGQIIDAALEREVSVGAHYRVDQLKGP